MELQALYDLQERLETAAAAGVRLAGEDFRLKRAVDSVAPLAEASPVIKKLHALALQTIAPDCTDRAGALLDTLALLEAVLCTQAKTGADGSLVPLELAKRPFSPCQPFRVVKPIMEALTGTGGGRYSVIQNALEESPEVFFDYRLQAAMVSALSDRYSDIAVLAENWLSRQDESFLPLLKQGFEECTDSGQVRCLRAIAAIAGKNENDFYKSLLAYAKKDLREEAIYALRHDRSNSGLLLDLLKTEKGNCLEAAKQVLALMGTPESDQYLASLLEKSPWEAVKYLNFSQSEELSERLGTFAHSFFDECDNASGKATKEQQEKTAILFDALAGKTSPSVLSLYERAAAGNRSQKDHYRGFPELLAKSLVLNCEERLVSCARSLAASHGKAWYPAALTADLLTQPAAEVFEQYKNCFPKASILGIGKEEKARTTAALMTVFGQINYVEKSDRHKFFAVLKEGGGRQQMMLIQRPLKENLDPRWFEFFTGGAVRLKGTIGCISQNGVQEKLDFDQLLAKIACPDIRPALGKYFYEKALIAADNTRLYKPLIQCGWRDFKDLVVRYVEKNEQNGFNYWQISRMLDQLPITAEDRMETIREIDSFICTYPVKSPVRKNWDSSSILRKMIDEAAGLPGGE